MRWLLAALLLGGCGYSPPGAVDTGSKTYQADLTQCRDGAATSVNKDNAKRALDWFASPVRRWGQISDATGSCMAGKGYGSLRWCSGEELAAARREGRVVVTSAGVQCASAPTKRS